MENVVVLRAREHCFRRRPGLTFPRGAEWMSVLPAPEASFFFAARLTFGSGCPAGLGKGCLRGHPSRRQSVESIVLRKQEHAFYTQEIFRRYPGGTQRHHLG